MGQGVSSTKGVKLLQHFENNRNVQTKFRQSCKTSLKCFALLSKKILQTSSTSDLKNVDNVATL